MTATLTENIEKLLPNAFRVSNSGRACRDAILASCDPDFYKLDFGDLCRLDGANTNAALALLTYRLNEMDSVQRLMAPDQFQRLHDSGTETIRWTRMAIVISGSGNEAIADL